MDDQLHAAGFVEEALHHQPPLGRQRPQRSPGPRQVFDDLPRRRFAEANLLAQSLNSPLDAFRSLGQLPSPPGRGAGGEGCISTLGLHHPSFNPLPQPRHCRRQFIGAPRRLPQPEGNVRRLALGVLHPHPSRLHAEDAIALVAQLEHIAGQALHGKILVHAAHRHALGFQQHRVVGGVGNRATGGDGGQARGTPATQAAIQRIAVQVGATHALAAVVALGQHPHQGIEALPRQVRIGHGADHQAVQLVLAPLLAGHLGHHLLGQHIQRRMGDDQRIQFVAAHAIEQGRALDQVVPRLREQPPLGRAADAVAGAADPLQEGGDAAWRTELADQLHVTDVDAQLQRGGGHQHLELATLEALLGVQAQFPRQAAVVGGHGGSAQALGKMAGDALSQAPGVDENQGGAMFGDQFGQAVVDLLPGLIAQHHFQRHRRHFEGQVALAAVAHVHQGAGTPALAHEERRHTLDGFLRGGQADALQAASAQGFQALGAEHQVAAALAAGDGVDLVDDQAAAAGQHGAAGVGAEEDIEGFGRGHQDVRRALAHGVALGLGRITGAHGGADSHIRKPQPRKLRADARQGFFQVDADVIGQRLQR
ncbi:hypothetical protein D9M70_214520 [compost metagenome]